MRVPTPKEEQNVVSGNRDRRRATPALIPRSPSDAPLEADGHLALEHRDKLILIVATGVWAVAMRAAGPVATRVALQHEGVACATHRRQRAEEIDVDRARAHQLAHSFRERVARSDVALRHLWPPTRWAKATQRPELLRDEESAQSHVVDDECPHTVLVVF
jgi:hypothetical protein